MRFSVPGYDIYDIFGAILYDGSIVRKDWGGGGGPGQRYRVYAYHQLSISPRGKLSVENYYSQLDFTESRRTNLNPTELVCIAPSNPSYLKHGLNKPFKVYI